MALVLGISLGILVLLCSVFWLVPRGYWATLLSRSSNKTAQLLPPGFSSLKGKTVLVTGANSGLGYATAVHLCALGAHTIAACNPFSPPWEIPPALVKNRIEAGAQKMVAKMRRRWRCPADHQCGTAELLALDLTNFTMVKAQARALAARGTPLAIVILNAGACPKEARFFNTPSGAPMERSLGLVAGHFLLANLLLRSGLLAGGADGKAARVVAVASEAHRFGVSLAANMDHVLEARPFGMTQATNNYSFTKSVLVAWYQEFRRRIASPGPAAKGPLCFSLCPGAMATNIAHDVPLWIGAVLGPLMKAFFKGPATSCLPVVALATDPRLDQPSGAHPSGYWHIWVPKPVKDECDDPKVGTTIWSQLAQITALDE